MFAPLFRSGMPDQVTKSFWQALLVEDLQTAKKYATEESQERIELPDASWKNATVRIGEIRISDQNATVETVIFLQSKTELPPFSLLTYLIKEQGAWKVDFNRTRHSFPGGIFEGLFKSLQNLGETFSKELEKEIPLLEKELESFSRDLKEQLDEFGRELEKITKPKKDDQPDSI